MIDVTNIQRFADSLVAAHFAVDTAERQIDTRLAKATFDGMVKGAVLLGLAPTDFAIEISLVEALVAQEKERGDRPTGIRTRAQSLYDSQVANRLVAKFLGR